MQIFTLQTSWKYYENFTPSHVCDGKKAQVDLAWVSRQSESTVICDATTGTKYSQSVIAGVHKSDLLHQPCMVFSPFGHPLYDAQQAAKPSLWFCPGPERGWSLSCKSGTRLHGWRFLLLRLSVVYARLLSGQFLLLALLASPSNFAILHECFCYLLFDSQFLFFSQKNKWVTKLVWLIVPGAMTLTFCIGKVTSVHSSFDMHPGSTSRKQTIVGSTWSNSVGFLANLWDFGMQACLLIWPLSHCIMPGRAQHQIWRTRWQQTLPFSGCDLKVLVQVLRSQSYGFSTVWKGVPEGITVCVHRGC